MNKSYFWQLYITGHTYLFGIPFLFFPNQVLPWLGFPPTNEPWIRIAGILFLLIGYSSYSAYKIRLRETIIPSIKARSAVVLVLLYLTYRVHSWFIFIMAIIVLIGVVGSIVSYRHDSLLMEQELLDLRSNQAIG